MTCTLIEKRVERTKTETPGPAGVHRSLLRLVREELATEEVAAFYETGVMQALIPPLTAFNVTAGEETPKTTNV